MNYVLRGYAELQRHMIRRIQHTRATRPRRYPGDANEEASLEVVRLPSSWDRQTVEFLKSYKHGGREAEAFLIRTFQHVAGNNGITGRIGVDREMFGPVVLTRRWHAVTSARGAAFFDHAVARGVFFVPDGDAHCGTQRGTSRAEQTQG